jgi:hypothetical protein
MQYGQLVTRSTNPVERKTSFVGRAWRIAKRLVTRDTPLCSLRGEKPIVVGPDVTRSISEIGILVGLIILLAGLIRVWESVPREGFLSWFRRRHLESIKRAARDAASIEFRGQTVRA